MSSRSKHADRRRGKGISLGEKLVGLVILVVVIWVVYTLAQPPPPPPTTPSGTPDFTLPVVGPNGLTGEKVTFSSFLGKVVFLQFMVPWCPHCQNMAPVLERLYRQYGPQNVVFLSVSASWSGATADDAARFIRAYHSTWIYVYDSSGTTFSAWGVTATPTFFVIGKNGQIANTYQGEPAAETIAAELTRLNA
jgi:thiol-disulfide isomerase/thioredoxin